MHRFWIKSARFSYQKTHFWAHLGAKVVKIFQKTALFARKKLKTYNI